MKSGGAAKSYHKITMYVYLFFYFILFLLVVKNGGDEIVTKGEGIYKTIVAAIACLQVTPVFFMFPVGSSLCSYPLHEKENKPLCRLDHVAFRYPCDLCGNILQ